jgi:plasmid stabilization system protein ParE
VPSCAVIDYRLSNEALADLDEIRRYITKRDSEAAADNVEIQIFDAFDQLVRLPMIGHRRFDVKQETMLFHNVPNMSSSSEESRG